MRAFLAIFFLFYATSVSALEFSYIKKTPFDGNKTENTYLLLKGEIMPGDYQALLNFIASDLKSFLGTTAIALSLYDGDIDEAIKIGRFIKKTHAHVSVGEYTGKCTGACFLLYASAISRDALPSTLGINRPYLNPYFINKSPPDQVENIKKTAFDKARMYLKEQRVPVNIIDEMFRHSSIDVYWLTDSEIHDQIGKRSPWYEEFLIARCNLKPDLEERYYRTVDKDLIMYINGVYLCGKEQSKTEMIRALEYEFNKYNISINK